MRNVAILVLGLGLLACDKPNPNFCCSTEADCMAQGLPTANACAEGLICRGNQCILEGCTTSGDCDAAAPFCENQTCAETCTADPECPGFGEDPGDAFCVGGTCVACRAMMDDCPASAPVCDTNACRGCQLDDECPSRVCNVDAGTCVDESTVLYASPDGTATSGCTQGTPCSIASAVTLSGAAHPLIRMLPGDYPVSITFPIAAPITIIGTDATLTGIATQTTVAMSVLDGATVTIRGLAIDTSTHSLGIPVKCNLSSGLGILSLRRVVVTSAATSEAVQVGHCHLTMEEVVSGGVTINGDSTTMTVDRSKVSAINATFGDTDLMLSVTNSVLSSQVELPTSGAGPISVRVSFSTITGTGQSCVSNVTSRSILFDNDIIINDPAAGNPNAIFGPAACFDHDLVFQQLDGSIGTNMIFANPKFVDVANDDFHLASNSPAIDSADPAATDAFDFDGVSRPQGTERDIGAFEFKP